MNLNTDQIDGHSNGATKKIKKPHDDETHPSSWNQFDLLLYKKRTKTSRPDEIPSSCRRTKNYPLSFQKARVRDAVQLHPWKLSQMRCQSISQQLESHFPEKEARYSRSIIQGMCMLDKETRSASSEYPKTRRHKGSFFFCPNQINSY